MAGKVAVPFCDFDCEIPETNDKMVDQCDCMQAITITLFFSSQIIEKLKLIQ